MPEDEYGAFEFSELSSLERTERQYPSLSKVRRDLYQAMIALQERQNKECETLAAIDMDDVKFDAANSKKKSIAQKIRNVVEMRMQKVAQIATKSAMGGDTSVVETLPPEERTFYEEVLEASRKLWAARTKKVKKITYPDLAPELNPVIPPQEPEIPFEEISPIAAKAFAEEPAEEIPAPVQELPEDMSDIYIPEEVLSEGETKLDIPPIPEEELADIPAETPAAVPAEQPAEEAAVTEENPFAESEDLITIRMVESLPYKLSGLDRDYSLKKEDVVRMPECIASILVRKNLAVKLNI